MLDTPDDIYLDWYASNTDRRVLNDPQTAIGGLWDELGLLQFNKALELNLSPSSTFLDYGCGTGRLSRHLINYLDSGNYYGVDISKKAIQYNQLKFNRENKGNLSHIKSGELPQDWLNIEFDFIWLHSVFTHLSPSLVKKVLFELLKLLKDDSEYKKSKIVFTYRESENASGYWNSWSYPMEFFIKLIYDYEVGLGSNLKVKSIDYEHPRQQKMLMIYR